MKFWGFRGSNFMKIFSLESKKHLVLWSLAAAFLITKLISDKTFRYIPWVGHCDISGCFSTGGTQFGFPLVVKVADFSFVKVMIFQLANYLFWFLVVFIVLSLIRYFRKKNKPASSWPWVHPKGKDLNYSLRDSSARMLLLRNGSSYFCHFCSILIIFVI